MKSAAPSRRRQLPRALNGDVPRGGFSIPAKACSKFPGDGSERRAARGGQAISRGIPD
jgi:hypothetical protein